MSGTSDRIALVWRPLGVITAIVYFAVAQFAAIAHARSLDAVAPGHDTAACVLCVSADRNGATPSPPAPVLPIPVFNPICEFAVAVSDHPATVIEAAQPRGPPSR